MQKTGTAGGNNSEKPSKTFHDPNRDNLCLSKDKKVFLNDFYPLNNIIWVAGGCPLHIFSSIYGRKKI